MIPLDKVLWIVGEACDFLGIAEHGVSRPEEGTIEVGFTTAEDADAFLALFTPKMRRRWHRTSRRVTVTRKLVWQRVDRAGDATPAVVGLRIPEKDVPELLGVTMRQRYGPGVFDEYLVEHGKLDPADVRHVHPWVDEA